MESIGFAYLIERVITPQVMALASSLCKPPDSANKDEDPEQTELTAEV